jgi:hypothetical protein
MGSESQIAFNMLSVAQCSSLGSLIDNKGYQELFADLVKFGRSLGFQLSNASGQAEHLLLLLHNTSSVYSEVDNSSGHAEKDCYILWDRYFSNYLSWTEHVGVAASTKAPE